MREAIPPGPLVPPTAHATALRPARAARRHPLQDALRNSHDDFSEDIFSTALQHQTSDDGCVEQVGGALLNVVHTQAVAIGAGRGGASGGGAEDETRGVLHYLLQSACAPFFEILGCWIYEGNHPTIISTLSAPYSFA